MIFSKLSPKYTIVNGPGFSGNDRQLPEIARAGIKEGFNPFRLQYGGTQLVLFGKKRWFSDKTIIGKILRFIFE